MPDVYKHRFLERFIGDMSFVPGSDLKIEYIMYVALLSE